MQTVLEIAYRTAYGRRRFVPLNDLAKGLASITRYGETFTARDVKILQKLGFTIRLVELTKEEDNERR